MRYLAITTWELLAEVDFDVTMERIKSKRLPALRKLGAERIQVIRTSSRTIAAISEWPDKHTFDSASVLIDRVRKDVHAEDHSRMTGEMRGELVAEV